MTMQKTLSTKFQVNTHVAYINQQSNPDEQHYFFAYRIQITNQGENPAQLLNRHWIITDGYGRTEEVRGAGVIGQQPRIMPGKSFEYESACPLNTPTGTMRGYYQMIDDSGEIFEVEITEFFLIYPDALH